MSKAYQKKVEAKIELGLSDEDWMLAPLGNRILNAMPDCPVVRAGDGGIWVPVYVYISRRKT